MLTRFSKSLIVLVVAFSCGDLTFAQHRALATRLQSECNPAERGALVARPNDVIAQPTGHTVLEASTLRLSEAKYVEGSCVADIASFVAGNARLRSGKIFVVWDEGKVLLHPPQGLDSQDTLPARGIEGLPGYGLVTIKRIGLRRTSEGERKMYLGLFRGKHDYLIARFDVLNGKPSRNAELLIRATSPISGLNFLPAPDTPDGSIGFVQHVGPNRAWLYAYSWHHGDLAALSH